MENCTNCGYQLQYIPPSKRANVLAWVFLIVGLIGTPVGIGIILVIISFIIGFSKTEGDYYHCPKCGTSLTRTQLAREQLTPKEKEKIKADADKAFYGSLKKWSLGIGIGLVSIIIIGVVGVIIFACLTIGLGVLIPDEALESHPTEVNREVKPTIIVKDLCEASGVMNADNLNNGKWATSVEEVSDPIYPNPGIIVTLLRDEGESPKWVVFNKNTVFPLNESAHEYTPELDIYVLPELIIESDAEKE